MAIGCACSRLPAGERGGEFDAGLHGAAAGAVGVAHRGRPPQILDRPVELAKRGGRLPEWQLHGA